ncbi:hypothetical protein AB0C81_00940 [Streptomyces roseoverticillatus]|uniref:hypothetical protein n=1 Tax=Streptomyces roseoverticillatus TaxID=66429 RepID=UPI0033E23B93
MNPSVRLECARDGAVVETVLVAPDDSYPYSLTVCRASGEEVVYSGESLLACLVSFRKVLEQEGLLLCCQGARSDVTSSGMQSQMTGSRWVYVFDREERKLSGEVVDILAPAGPEEAVTVAEQRAELFRFLGIPDPGCES